MESWTSNYAVWQYSQAGQVMFSHDARNNRVTNYVYLGGSLVALREQPMSGGTTVTVKYQHTDALGTPIAVTDASKAIIETSEYEPYGQLVNRALTDGPGFTGHVQDAATGLTYMQQRYYDPFIGRFLSVDPVTANASTGANFNRYKYAANNPYRFVDPDGRQEKVKVTGSNIPGNSVAMARITVTASGIGTGENKKAGEAVRGGAAANGEASFVRSIVDKFRGQDYEVCAKICLGESGYALSDIRNDGSQLACDVGPAQCPAGTEEVSDIHSHLKSGDYFKNVADVRLSGSGRVGDAFRISPRNAQNFSSEDRRLGRELGINGWLVPAVGDVFKFYNHATNKVTEYEISN